MSPRDCWRKKSNVCVVRSILGSQGEPSAGMDIKRGLCAGRSEAAHAAAARAADSARR